MLAERQSGVGQRPPGLRLEPSEPVGLLGEPGHFGHVHQRSSPPQRQRGPQQRGARGRVGGVPRSPHQPLGGTGVRVQLQHIAG
nr:hypothetical protein [Streptomyces graminofaciens]